MRTFLYHHSLQLLILSASILVNACESREVEVSQVPNDNEKPVAAREFVKNLPKIKFYDSSDANSRISDFSNPGSFDFSDRPDGVSFSSSADISFQETPDGNYILVDIRSLGAGGGSVTAGKNTYDIGLAFCLSASDSIDLVDTRDGSGISGIIGFSGSEVIDGLDDLDNEDSGEDFLEGLDVIVYYLVFDDQAQGKYSVSNYYSEDQPGSQTGLAVIYDFKEEMYYVSSGGSIDVASNTMTFQGSYYVISDGDIDIEEEVPGEMPEEVNGSGTMGCQ